MRLPENFMKPRVKDYLDEQRVWVSPSWTSDEDSPFIDRSSLQRQLTRLGNKNGVTFFVTFTRQEDGGMDGAAVATQQLDAYRYLRGFPTYTYCVLVVVRSKRHYEGTERYTYTAGMRVGRSLKAAGFDDADQARVFRDSGSWLDWENPHPSPAEFASEVARRTIGELSRSFVTRHH